MKNNHHNKALDTGGNRPPSSAPVEAESQRAIQEVQAAFVIAQRFPRDTTKARERILEACDSKALAEVALYQYQRGNKELVDSSIRLAETVARHWGNIQFGMRELDRRDGESSVEAFSWDLETNTRVVKTFAVPHERHTNRGKKRLTDPRDIYEALANAGARRLRACIMVVIPSEVFDAAKERCLKTLESKPENSEDAWKKMMAAFGEYGVTQAMIEKRLGKKIAAITPNEIVALRSIYSSLKDGISQPSEWFDMPEAAQTADVGNAPPAAEDAES